MLLSRNEVVVGTRVVVAVLHINSHKAAPSNPMYACKYLDEELDDTSHGKCIISAGVSTTEDRQYWYVP